MLKRIKEKIDEFLRDDTKVIQEKINTLALEKGRIIPTSQYYNQCTLSLEDAWLSTKQILQKHPNEYYHFTDYFNEIYKLQPKAMLDFIEDNTLFYDAFCILDKQMKPLMIWDNYTAELTYLSNDQDLIINIQQPKPPYFEKIYREDVSWAEILFPTYIQYEQAELYEFNMPDFREEHLLNQFQITCAILPRGKNLESYLNDSYMNFTLTKNYCCIYNFLKTEDIIELTQSTINDGHAFFIGMFFVGKTLNIDQLIKKKGKKEIINITNEKTIVFNIETSLQHGFNIKAD